MIVLLSCAPAPVVPEHAPAQVQAPVDTGEPAVVYPPHPGPVHHACALGPGGAVWCWGDNAAGQLGRGRFTPLEPQSREEALSVYERGLHLDGSRTEEPPAPIAAQGDTRFASISLGRTHSCALDTAGAVWCWGRNVEGQVGPPVVVPRMDARTWGGDVPTPVHVVLPEPAVRVLAGGNGTCAVLSSTARCWGHRAEPQTIPVDQIESWIGETNARASCELRGQGEVWCQTSDSPAARVSGLPAVTDVDVSR